MVSQDDILMLPLKLALTRLSSPLSMAWRYRLSGHARTLHRAWTGGILLYVGGNLVVGKHDFADVETSSKRWDLIASLPQVMT